MSAWALKKKKKRKRRCFHRTNRERTKKPRKVKQVISDIYPNKTKFTINCELVDRSHTLVTNWFFFSIFQKWTYSNINYSFLDSIIQDGLLYRKSSPTSKKRTKTAKQIKLYMLSNNSKGIF